MCVFETKKNEDGVVDIKYYCDIENGYIDCEELERCGCISKAENNEYFAIDIWINGTKTKVNFEFNWLYEQVREIGYACVYDFANFGWFDEREELLKRAMLNKYNKVYTIGEM